jgi:hypothetical protein
VSLAGVRLLVSMRLDPRLVVRCGPPRAAPYAGSTRDARPAETAPCASKRKQRRGLDTSLRELGAKDQRHGERQIGRLSPRRGLSTGGTKVRCRAESRAASWSARLVPRRPPASAQPARHRHRLEQRVGEHVMLCGPVLSVRPLLRVEQLLPRRLACFWLRRRGRRTPLPKSHRVCPLLDVGQPDCPSWSTRLARSRVPRLLPSPRGGAKPRRARTAPCSSRRKSAGGCRRDRVGTGRRP